MERGYWSFGICYYFLFLHFIRPLFLHTLLPFSNRFFHLMTTLWSRDSNVKSSLGGWFRILRHLWFAFFLSSSSSSSFYILAG